LIVSENAGGCDPRASTCLVTLLTNSERTSARNPKGIRIAELADWDQVLIRLIDGGNVGHSEIKNWLSALETFRSVESFRAKSRSFKHEGNQARAMFPISGRDFMIDNCGFTAG
jgi:hypothetical protein